MASPRIAIPSAEVSHIETERQVGSLVRRGHVPIIHLQTSAMNSIDTLLSIQFVHLFIQIATRHGRQVGLIGGILAVAD